MNLKICLKTVEATPALATNTQLPPSFQSTLKGRNLIFIILTEPICRPYPRVRTHIVCDTSIPKQFTEVYEINKHLTLLYIIVLPAEANQ